ncbi:MAG: tmoS 2 [Gemmataceae bacterium]|nr:tmoS 2 [Gemmataceae bacterium]
MFQKGLILIALPLLFQLAFVLVVVRFQRDHVEAGRWATHTKEVITQVHVIHTTVSDAGAGVRGYVISHDPAFAGPFRDASRDLPGQLDGLAGLVSDNPGQATRARAVRSAADALLAWQGGIEQLVRGGAADEAAARVRSGHGQTLVDDFRREVGLFLAEEERLDRDRLVALDQSRERLNIVLVAGGVVAVICTLALACAFRRGVARRFAALEANTRRLAAGEPLPPPLSGADEIASLDRAFRDMAAALTRAAGEVRDLYDNAPCGYHSVDPTGTIVEVNRTELRWLGYEAGEMVGRVRFVDLVSPASRDAYQQGFARVREHGAVAAVELNLVRKDGTTFPVLVSSSSVRDPAGRYVRSRTTLTDLTERKRAEDEVRRLNADLEERVRARTDELGRAYAALREEEALFRGAFDNTNVAMVLTDLDNRFLRANAAFARLLGYTPAEVQSLGLADVTHPDHLGESLDRREVLLAGAGDYFQMEKRYRHRAGHLLWGLTNVALTRGPDGRPLMYVGQVQDITERKAAEEAVRERAAELAEANRDLAQKNAENEMFVYSVSHDLRSPLVNLQGFSKELEKGCQQLTALLAEEAVPPAVRDRGRTLLGGKMAKSVGFIQSAVLRLSGIIDALLRLSRAGRVEYRWEAADVGRVVGHVVGAAQGTIAERGAAVLVGDLPAAWGDRTAIEQVFGNLIGNALTYLDPARPGVIEVGCLPSGAPGVPNEFQAYFVRDNGLGIAEGHRQKIFQAFQRAHPGVGSGEGLGLAIVARVAERHRGRVWVESRPGEGSTFYVTLPATPGAVGGR